MIVLNISLIYAYHFTVTIQSTVVAAFLPHSLFFSIFLLDIKAINYF